jgi:hypothetical protein
MRRNGVPIGTHGRRKARFVLRRTRIRIRQVLEHVLCRLLVLFLVDNDVGLAVILSRGRIDTGNDLGELFRILVLLDALAAPCALRREVLVESPKLQQGYLPIQRAWYLLPSERRPPSLFVFPRQSPGNRLLASDFACKHAILTSITLSPANACATKSLCLNALGTFEGPASNSSS